MKRIFLLLLCTSHPIAPIIAPTPTRFSKIQFKNSIQPQLMSAYEQKLVDFMLQRLSKILYLSMSGPSLVFEIELISVITERDSILYLVQVKLVIDSGVSQRLIISNIDNSNLDYTTLPREVSTDEIINICNIVVYNICEVFKSTFAPVVTDIDIKEGIDFYEKLGIIKSNDPKISQESSIQIFTETAKASTNISDQGNFYRDGGPYRSQAFSQNYSEADIRLIVDSKVKDYKSEPFNTKGAQSISEGGNFNKDFEKAFQSGCKI